MMEYGRRGLAGWPGWLKRYSDEGLNIVTIVEVGRGGVAVVIFEEY